LRGIATLKVSGDEDRALDQWSNRFYRNLNVLIRRRHFSALVELALNALATACLSQLQSLAMSGQRLQLVGAHLARIANVADTEPEHPVENLGLGQAEAATSWAPAADATPRSSIVKTSCEPLAISHRARRQSPPSRSHPVSALEPICPGVAIAH
jgi:ABC-type bacteriocin/lantibiotic exporter with double-glycine peptidase domain